MKRSDNMTSSADTQCCLTCDCGEEFSISDYGIFRCPKCGKGYRTEFFVWEYESNETSLEYEEASIINARADEHWRELEQKRLQEFLTKMREQREQH